MKGLPILILLMEKLGYEEVKYPHGTDNHNSMLTLERVLSSIISYIGYRNHMPSKGHWIDIYYNGQSCSSKPLTTPWYPVMNLICSRPYSSIALTSPCCHLITGLSTVINSGVGWFLFLIPCLYMPTLWSTHHIPFLE